MQGKYMRYNFLYHLVYLYTRLDHLHLPAILKTLELLHTQKIQPPHHNQTTMKTTMPHPL